MDFSYFLSKNTTNGLMSFWTFFLQYLVISRTVSDCVNLVQFMFGSIHPVKLPKTKIQPRQLELHFTIGLNLSARYGGVPSNSLKKMVGCHILKNSPTISFRWDYFVSLFSLTMSTLRKMDTEPVIPCTLLFELPVITIDDTCEMQIIFCPQVLCVINEW